MRRLARAQIVALAVALAVAQLVPASLAQAATPAPAQDVRVPAAQAAASAPVQGFRANPPGTYTLPSIQRAGDGWVLERNYVPRRLARYTRGAVTLLSFVYTYCTDPIGCPLAYEVFVDVRNRVIADAGLRGKVRFVSLSFDPANDSPQAMQRYGGEFARAPELPWHFLTTTSIRFLKPILDAYGQDVEIERDAAGAPTRAITHLLKVFLIDPRGNVREIYSTAFLHPEVVFNDVRTLVLEAASEAAPSVSASAKKRAGPGAGDDSAPAGNAMGTRPGESDLALPDAAARDGVVLDPVRVALGRRLFVDRRLSANGTMSCAMCHVPEQAFASNASARAIGIAGATLRRNAPSLLDVAWRRDLFHDGRESSLVAQAWMPMLAADEMGNGSVAEVLARIRALDDYAATFARVFPGTGVSKQTVGAALAAFQASLRSGDSRFDRWRFGGDAAALSDDEQRGWRVFSGKGRCTACHRVDERSARLSDGRYHVTGAGFSPRARFVVALAPGVQIELADEDLAAFARSEAPDRGRFEVTNDPADLYAFRTPMLRNVSRTAPYMHDGSIATLEEVVAFYDRGGGDVAGKSPLLTRLRLSPEEKNALIAFLRSL